MLISFFMLKNVTGFIFYDGSCRSNKAVFFKEDFVNVISLFICLVQYFFHHKISLLFFPQPENMLVKFNKSVFTVEIDSPKVFFPHSKPKV